MAESKIGKQQTQRWFDVGESAICVKSVNQKTD